MSTTAFSSAWVDDDLRDVASLRKEFFTREAAPLEEKFRKQDHPDKDLYARAGELGLCGMSIPEEYGEWVGAIAMTEPGTGSDLQATTTRAVRGGSDYLVSGSKTFISNGQLCDLVVIGVKTDTAQGAKGISLLVAEVGADTHCRPVRRHTGVARAGRSQRGHEGTHRPLPVIPRHSHRRGPWRQWKESSRERTT